MVAAVVETEAVVVAEVADVVDVVDAADVADVTDVVVVFAVETVVAAVVVVFSVTIIFSASRDATALATSATLLSLNSVSDPTVAEVVVRVVEEVVVFAAVVVFEEELSAAELMLTEDSDAESDALSPRLRFAPAAKETTPIATVNQAAAITTGLFKIITPFGLFSLQLYHITQKNQIINLENVNKFSSSYKTKGIFL